MIENFQIPILSFFYNSWIHHVTNLIKLAPLCPGLVRLAIFLDGSIEIPTDQQIWSKVQQAGAELGQAQLSLD